ncbi:MAG: SIS domain-containing protein [Lentisphaerae bacterium]|nr:SIS domain-containing protein [Lentisphaerota bacterium]
MGENSKWMRDAIGVSAATIGALADSVDAIEAIGQAVVGVLKAGGKILTAGNGGSAAEALHMSEEFVGRFRHNRRSLPAISLVADPTALTCIGNDFGFDYIFSRQIEGLGCEGDALVLFSSSGKAANLQQAVEVARGLGLITIALLGRDGGPLAGRCDHELIVVGAATERIQEAHQVILHLILDMTERAFEVDDV